MPPVGHSTAKMASCMPPPQHAKPPSPKSLKYSKTASCSSPRNFTHRRRLLLINLKPPSILSPRNSTPSAVFLAKPLNRKRYPVDICFCSPCNSTLKEDQKDKHLPLAILEAVSEDALLAAANLRVRTFYEFNQSFGVEEHRRYKSQLEFEALKDRIAGKIFGFRRVTCVIATIPISKSLSLTDDLCSLCKVIINGEERIVVGTLDLNQTSDLPDEIPGSHPKGIDAQFTRAYLTNVCVAQELQRKGIGSALIIQAVKIAQQWGMTDIYVHVAVDNDAAKCLYEKSGFIYENDEPAWRARFLGRPRRFLLWANMNEFVFHQ